MATREGMAPPDRPADATPAAQADAHACLLDTLGIRQAAVLGGSAGALSAVQLAIRHPDRVTALVLVVPLAHKPSAVADSVPAPSALAETMLMWLIGSDFLFWATLHVARDLAIRWVLATPPERVASASAAERARVHAMLDHILPLSARSDGLRNDAMLAKHRVPYALEAIRAPTLVVSTRDDGFGIYAGAQYTASRIPGAKFIGYDQGGHVWAGHDEEIQEEVMRWVLANTQP